MDHLPPVLTPTEDWTHNLGMCPDWESNPEHLVHGMSLQPTENHLDRAKSTFLSLYSKSTFATEMNYKIKWEHLAF